MSAPEAWLWVALRHGAAVVAAAIALMLIFAQGMYASERETDLKGLMSLAGLVMLYTDWRRGLLGGPVSELPRKLREPGRAPLGCLQPLPMLALALSLIAGVVSALRG